VQGVHEPPERGTPSPCEAQRMSTPLYHSYDPVTQRATEITTDTDAGLVFVHSQNTKPIVESAKAIASSFDPLVRRDTIHVARIPMVIYQRLQKLGITKDRKAFDAWLNDRDNSVFRTDDRSVL
jgi:hypothetical protein